MHKPYYPIGLFTLDFMCGCLICYMYAYWKFLTQLSFHCQLSNVLQNSREEKSIVFTLVFIINIFLFSFLIVTKFLSGIVYQLFEEITLTILLEQAYWL
jgi:hypothetical protein